MPMQWHAKDIVALRARLKLTQGALALRLGVDQTTVSRWERGVQSPDSTTGVQLNGLLLEATRATGVAPEISLVKWSPFPMSIIAQDWTILAASAPLAAITDAFSLDADWGRSRPRKKPCADLETAVSRLKEQGFFEGKVSAARLVARGFVHGYDHWPFESVCTPVFVEGAICRLSQYQFLSETEFAKRCSAKGSLTLLK